MFRQTNARFPSQEPRELNYRTARTGLWALLGMIVLVLPALGQEDRCYPGLDCPDEPLYNAPPRPQSSFPSNRYPEESGYDREGVLPPLLSEQDYSRREYSSRPRYSAHSYCSVTGADGSYRGASTPEEALAGAYLDCVDRGGIPRCCISHTHLVE